jgi:ribonuclease E
VENRLKDALRHDRARIQVGRISHFGLLEMSRQRLRTGVVEGSTSQCPHCQGTGIVRSTESVALAVLRAIDDQLLRDARSSLTAVTTAEVALYILNNKRSFITEMERRHGLSITVVASDRMQGANFAIEKSAAPVAPPKAAERPAAVNMEWGFEGQDGEEEGGVESVPAEPEAEADDRRPRRRRRRSRRGDDRGEPRARPEPSRFAANGDAHPERTGDDRTGEAPDSARAELDAGADIPGTGDQPPGPVDEETEDRRGRRRRRGRRGGRRGREREAPQLGADAGPEPDLQPGLELGEMRALDPETMPADADVPIEPRAEPDAPEPEPQAPARAEAVTAQASPPSKPEPHWRAGADAGAGRGTDAGVEYRAEPPMPAQAPAREPPHMEPEPDDPSKPARKGWWQRRLAGE